MLKRRVLVACLFVGASLAPAGAAQAHHFPKRTLTKGAHGADVRVLQDFLGRLGYSAGVDGQFGPRTWRAVRRWERASGRRVDGRVHISDARALVASVKAKEASAPAAAAPAVQAPIEKATIAPDGTAVAPASAPPEIKAIIAAGNEISHKPYKYGGGHGRWNDSGYDCSGSMSFALHGAGLLDEALDSSGFMSFGEAGKGRWLTIYAHGGHAYMMVAGLRFDTSGMDADGGSRWHTARRSSGGYTVRHLPGL